MSTVSNNEQKKIKFDKQTSRSDSDLVEDLILLGIIKVNFFIHKLERVFFFFISFILNLD